MEVDINYITHRLNEKFTCTICGCTDCVKNAHIEICSVHSNSRTTYNMMGAGTRITTTYYNFFRICNKCGNERNHIRELASKSHLWICGLLLIAGIICICFHINGYPLIIASVALFVFYRAYKDIFCMLFKTTRKSPNTHLDYGSNSIGQVPQLWDFPKFIPNPNAEIDYESSFRCPKCSKIMPINGAYKINHCIGKTYYFAGNFEGEIEHMRNVRICTHCWNKYNSQIIFAKKTLAISLAIICIALFVLISINTNDWKPSSLFFLAIFSYGIYWGILNFIRVTLQRRLIKSSVGYAELKNDNAIDN